MPRLSAKISLSMITKIVNDFVVVLRDKSFSLFKNGIFCSEKNVN